MDFRGIFCCSLAAIKLMRLAVTIQYLAVLLLLLMNPRVQVFAGDSLGPAAWLADSRQALEKLARQEQAAAPSAQLMESYFASEEIGRHVLGPELWQGLKSDERQEFLHEFGTLLELALGKKIKEYADMQFVQTEAQQLDQLARVSYVSRGPDKEVRLVYTLHLVAGEWRIFDINVDGVSLLRSYMVQLRPVARERGFAAVMSALAAKVAALRE
jgi:phospholipid transport system substrate-binding protein